MKISGFTIVRNAVINDYPVVESIRSILPVVDEMVVALGDSEDETETMIRSIASDKVRIIHSRWDPTRKKGGEVLAIETDKALKEISPDSDWAFYIQADEVFHEKYHQMLVFCAHMFLSDPEVEGLLFDFVHFYGSYGHLADSRKWYSREVRFIRNQIGIHSYRDAQGFRKNGHKLKVHAVPVTMYHYGWVKTPAKMKEKLQHTHQFWEDSDSPEQKIARKAGDLFDFTGIDSLTVFSGTHPLAMQDRVSSFKNSLRLDVSRKQFSLVGRFLYWFEKGTGLRPFDYKNYTLL